MKKISIALLTIILILGLFAATFSAGAATTKEDLVEKVSASAIYKYIEGDIKNLSRTIDATPEQLDKLAVVADKFVALNLTDKGASAHSYTKAETQAVLALVDEALDVLGYRYTFTQSNASKHKGDYVFNIYDASNKLIYSYDGDVIKKTGSDQTVWFVLVAVLGGALLASAVVARRKAVQ